MNDAKLVNIARLLTTYNFEIEPLPDNLKCAQCKLVLKNACLLPCGCTFCRMCIDGMMLSGVELCPGDSKDCGEMALSTVVPDYRARNTISRLTAKCVHGGCEHACQLADMEEHLRQCPRKTEECPYRELGCTHDKVAAEEMGGHLQQDTRRHSEILIGMVANINREIEVLKQRDEASSREIGMLKDELELKDEQIKSIMDRLIHVENENKSIARENADLVDRVAILSEQIEKEIVDRRENDELDSTRMIVHVDMEMDAVMRVIGSNKDELSMEINSVINGIGSIDQSTQSINDDICSIKLQLQSIQEIVGLVDARCHWVITSDVGKGHWTVLHSWSEHFTGLVHPYKYRLASNNHIYKADSLSVCLQICATPNDGQLAWPFKGRVVITVADMDKRDACRSISRQCRIERPEVNQYTYGEEFVFHHSELRGFGLDLSRGVRVLCAVIPGVVR